MMIPATDSGHAFQPPSRSRSISVDDVGDVSHSNDDNDMNDYNMQHSTNLNNDGSKNISGSHSIPTDEYMSKSNDKKATTTTTTNTIPITRKNRRTPRTAVQTSTESTIHSNHTGSGNYSYNGNIDPLMGSMEFEESQASFTIDENGLLPGPGQDHKDDDDIVAAAGGDVARSSHDTSSSSSDDSDSSSQSSDYTNSIDKRRAAHKKRELTIGQKETLALRRTRSTLFCFIIMIAIVGAITISMITVQKEIQSFENDFALIGETIIQHIQQQMQLQLQSFDTLSNDILTITSLNVGSNTSAVWPFVTLPSSSAILERYMSLLQASMLCMYPIVQASERTQWEQYAIQSQGWIDDDLQNTIASIDTGNTNSSSAGNSRRTLMDDSSGVTSKNVFQPMSVPDSDSIPPYIHSANNVPLVINASGTYAVWWQYAPILKDRSIINFNAMTSTIQSMVISSGTTSPYTTMSPVQYYKPKKKKPITNDYETDDDINVTAATSPSIFADETIDMILQRQGKSSYSPGEPYSFIYYPIVKTTTSGSNEKNTGSIVAVLSATKEWKSYLEHAVSEGNGIVCVIHQNMNTIDHNDYDPVIFSFNIDADIDQVSFLGYEDFHDPNFDHLVVSYNITLDTEGAMYDYTGVPFKNDIVSSSIHIYPSVEFKDRYTTMTSLKVAGGMIICFIIALGVFCFYDSLVTKRQKIVMDNAHKTYNIVSSLFPATVRDRMMQDSTVQNHNDSSTMLGRSSHLQQLLLQPDSNHSTKSKFDPSTAIADFYPSATVLFSDITGFTAWCAAREPSQVFILLETIYSAFDTIAKKRKVFKVETIGDCYMAVVGLPEPREDHAIVMCRFARQCLSKLRGILIELEETLGPGTADLNMRFGLHSGPVTAGVLRVSQNARFQLFGDTVNTAARMESNGSPGMIHISQETANELTAHGKQGWFYPRSEKITAKGKGELQTYWVDLSVSSIDDRMSMSTSSIHSSLSLQQGNGKTDHRLKRTIGGREVELADVQLCRLVDWILDTLNPMLCHIVSRRLFVESQQQRSPSTGPGVQMLYGPNIMDDVISVGPPTFNDFDHPNGTATCDELPLDTHVSEQLHDYVHLIASRYKNDNTYHNFEHAAHAIMTIVSFMNRINGALKMFLESADSKENPNEQVLSMLKHMRNIFDDPITSFACVLAGLVHDVDHNGAPKHAASSAAASLNPNEYLQQLSTEQNAIHVAWSLLLQPEFKLLRQAIFGSSTSGSNRPHQDSDLNRFRYIFVRAVLATDIHPAHNRNAVQYDPNNSASKSLLYQEHGPSSHQSEMIDALLRAPSEIMGKAMSMIEYMMQLSDVTHMIQQWPIYMKWNERLFNEYLKYYNATNVGNNTNKASKRRSSSSDSTATAMSRKHPSVYWYETELRYMKQYVLPLTEKICAEFSGIMTIACSMTNDGGAPMCLPKNQKCSREYYVAITQLLNEWTLRGPTIIDEMASKSMGQRQQQQSNRISSNSSVDESNSIMNVSSILVLPQLHDQPSINHINNNSQSQASYDFWMDNISTTETQQQQQKHQVNKNSSSINDSGKQDSRANQSNHSSPTRVKERPTEAYPSAHCRPQPAQVPPPPPTATATTQLFHPLPPPLQRTKSSTSSQNPFIFL